MLGSKPIKYDDMMNFIYQDMRCAETLKASSSLASMTTHDEAGSFTKVRAGTSWKLVSQWWSYIVPAHVTLGDLCQLWITLNIRTPDYAPAIVAALATAFERQFADDLTPREFTLADWATVFDQGLPGDYEVASVFAIMQKAMS